MDKQEAIKILKEFHDKSALFSVRTALETVLPELKESEDERIRKHLISLVKNWDKGGIVSKYTSDANDIKQILAWLEKQGTSYTKRDVDDAFVEGMAFAKDELEKQGEQTINQPDFEIPFGAKDSELIEESYYIPKGYHAEISKDKVTIKKGEQKPAWSAEDTFKVQRICKYLCEAKKYYADITEVRDCIDWLKSFKQRIGG